jgi:MFS family permease
MPPRALPQWLAGGLVFLSSGAVLVLEIVGLRLVAPYIGVTLQTSSAVIGVALGAIAYGVWFGGWLADRRDPRRLLAPALVLAGIATALTLPVVRAAGEALRGNAAGGILMLTTLTVFVPAALLSSVTPMVIKLQLADLRHTGRVVGKLSSLGTLGAITATLGTGFVLVAALPSSVIMLVLAAILGVAGVALWIRWQREGRAARPGDPTTSPAARGVVAVVGLLGAGLTALAPNPCDVETAYHCARIEAQGTDGRLLLLNSARHSYVDLGDPEHLEFAYTQWIGAVADVIAPPGEPLDALHLGGGGFTLPRWLSATRPGSDHVVLELDGGLVELDRAELGVVPGPDLEIVVGDARVSLAGQPAASRDLVVGDAFGHLVVPWHLATREFTAGIRRVLRPEGVYAQNVIDYPPDRFIRAEVATVAAVFREVALIAPRAALAGQTGSNFVIVASDAPLPLEALAQRLAVAGPAVPVVLTGAELDRWVGDARVLTDDHAPVDQLLASP